MSTLGGRSERLAGWSTLGALVLPGAALVLCLAFASAERADARKATRAERQALLEVFNAGSYETPACQNAWITRVSAYKPRIAGILPNQKYRVKLDCVLSDGYYILRRPTPTSRRWRVISNRSDLPRCSVLPPRAAKELGFEGCMGRNFRTRTE